MPRIGFTGLPRKKSPFFLIAEKSEDIKTAIKVYELLENIRSALFDLQISLPDFEMKVGFYTFSSASCFLHPQKLVSPEELDFEKSYDNGIVDLSDVFCRLSCDLSTSKILNREIGYVAPNIILIFDGSKKYEDNGALSKLKENQWFRHARKIALYINEHDNIKNSVINQFTGTDEAILKVTDIGKTMEIFKSFFTYISIPGSIIANGHQSVNAAIPFVDPIKEDNAIPFVDPIEEDIWDDNESW